jgi:hypothetical protein
MTYDEQLQAWLRGESLCPNENGECCPDFSCCQSAFKATKQEREQFVAAHAAGDDETIYAMLLGFLGNALARYSSKVHIAGQEYPEGGE